MYYSQSFKQDLHTTASSSYEKQRQNQLQHNHNQRNNQRLVANDVRLGALHSNNGSGQTAQDPEQSEGERITGMLDNFAKALGKF